MTRGSARPRLAAAMLLLGVPVAACDLFLSFSGYDSEYGARDAANDGGEAGDASVIFNALDDKSQWEAFDLTMVAHDAGSSSYASAAFDGRYVYLVPLQPAAPLSALVLRYDTQGAFTDAAAWSSFDVGAPSGAIFRGAVFDARYLYFVPTDFNGGIESVVARYDTQGPFDAAWSVFNLAPAVAPGAKGFAGGAFDGRFVYLVPYVNTPDGGADGLVARYDTANPFTMGSSWSTFDVTSVSAGARGFVGGAFDGRYLYMAPNRGGGAIVARYDTSLGQAAFTTQAPWSTYNVAPLTQGTTAFAGAVFDNRHNVYLVPYLDAPPPDGGMPSSGSVVVRYDIQSAFADANSWSTFDTRTLDQAAAGFSGGVFDGRYVYLVPYFNTIVARYDTTQSGNAFGRSASAWETYGVQNVSSGAQGYSGAAFDGSYVYFVPYASSIALRFHARSPSGPSPMAEGGSFF